jgi:hypothetical protein
MATIQIDISDSSQTVLYDYWKEEVGRLYKIAERDFEMKSFTNTELVESWNQDETPDQFVDSLKEEMLYEDEDMENIIDEDDEENTIEQEYV